MRTALLLGFATVIAATSIACAVESADTGTSTALRKSAKHSTSADDEESADPNPTIGEHQVDTGNPNANSSPTAPTTTGTAAASFAMALDSNTPTVDLGKNVDLTVNITPSGAFNGSVSVSVDGLPEGVTASPTTATINGAATSVKVTLKAAVTAAVTPVGSQVALTIKGTSGSQTATAAANFKVNPKVTLTIPMNIAALKGASTTYRDEWGDAFGSNPQNLLTQADNPIVVTVFNNDSAPHIIHGANGFAHGDTSAPIQPNAFEMQNGAPRIRTFKPGAQGTGYPHDFGSDGPGASFHLNVGSTP